MGYRLVDTDVFRQQPLVQVFQSVHAFDNK